MASFIAIHRTIKTELRGAAVVAPSCTPAAPVSTQPVAAGRRWPRFSPAAGQFACLMTALASGSGDNRHRRDAVGSGAPPPPLPTVIAHHNPAPTPVSLRSAVTLRRNRRRRRQYYGRLVRRHRRRSARSDPTPTTATSPATIRNIPTDL